MNKDESSYNGQIDKVLGNFRFRCYVLTYNIYDISALYIVLSMAEHIDYKFKKFLNVILTF